MYPVPSQLQLKMMAEVEKKAKEQLVAKARVDSRNKELARQHLLSMQLLLAKRPIKE